LAKAKPRIRKSAPTVRERQEAAQAEKDQPSRKRLSVVSSKVAKPLAKIKPRGKVFNILAKPFRLIKRVLSWLVPSYFVNSWREVRQVTWPSRKETFRLTVAVFVFAIVFGALVAGVDKGLDVVFKKVVLK
jgi:preprotein translocase SecE subunit